MTTQNKRCCNTCGRNTEGIQSNQNIIERIENTMKKTRLPYSIIEDGHVKMVGTEIINQDSIIDMRLCSDANGNPVFQILTDVDNSGIYEIDLTNAFYIHKACEFLRSLELGDETSIEFKSFMSFSIIINYSMKLLNIKKIMKEMNYTGVLLPADIHSDMITRQSNRYGCNVLEDYADDLKPWIQKAITFLEKQIAKGVVMQG